MYDVGFSRRLFLLMRKARRTNRMLASKISICRWVKNCVAWVLMVE